MIATVSAAWAFTLPVLALIVAAILILLIADAADPVEEESDWSDWEQEIHERAAARVRAMRREGIHELGGRR